MWIWDLPGKESFIALNRMYLRDANAALILYDVNNINSFTEAESWITELKDTAPSELLFVLAGNKMDVQGTRGVSL